MRVPLAASVVSPAERLVRQCVFSETYRPVSRPVPGLGYSKCERSAPPYPSGNGPSINVNGVPSPFAFALASTSQAIATS